MQTLIIDLKKNASVADVVADMQPGDELKVITVIAHKDEQTLKLTLKEVVEIGAPDVDEEAEAVKESPEDDAALE